MELNDNEFDAAFRKKVSDADPQFEDVAWDRMERKLKHRDRVVFFRRSALVLLVLLVGMGGYYAFENTPAKHTDTASNKKKEQIDKTVPVGERNNKAMGSDDSLVGDGNSSVAKNDIGRGVEINRKVEPIGVQGTLISKLNNYTGAVLFADSTRKEVYRHLPSSGPISVALPDQVVLSGIYLPDTTQRMNAAIVKTIAPVMPASDEELLRKKGIKTKRSLPVSLAISAGPEFNSASSVVGGTPGLLQV